MSCSRKRRGSVGRASVNALAGHSCSMPRFMPASSFSHRPARGPQRAVVASARSEFARPADELRANVEADGRELAGVSEDVGARAAAEEWSLRSSCRTATMSLDGGVGAVFAAEVDLTLGTEPDERRAVPRPL
jgi:hypothetical protein